MGLLDRGPVAGLRLAAGTFVSSGWEKYRGTSLVRVLSPVGINSSPMPRDLSVILWGGLFLMIEVPLWAFSIAAQWQAFDWLQVPNPEANLMSICHRCHPILVAFVWQLT
jgi:hypothetical protein